MGDKITAKETMIAAHVPVIPGSEGLITDISEGKIIAKDLGYPVILKATAGGGGKGMRIVWGENEFENAFNSMLVQKQVHHLETTAFISKNTLKNLDILKFKSLEINMAILVIYLKEIVLSREDTKN
jgi:biotin carboxylase